MVHYDNCQNSYHNEPLSCMGAKASQPTHFLKVRLTGVRLSEIHCIAVCRVLATGFPKSDHVSNRIGTMLAEGTPGNEMHANNYIHNIQ